MRASTRRISALVRDSLDWCLPWVIATGPLLHGSERDRDPLDDVADSRFCFVPCRHVPLDMGGEPHTVGENRDGKIVDVVRDAVGPSPQECSGARGLREVHSGPG